MRAIEDVLGRELPRLALPRLPSLRKAALIAALAAVLLTLGWLWLRDSTFVSVERVEVTGLTSADADRLREALTSAGRGMTTLHVDDDRLRAAVAGYPVVREVRATPDFPHALFIEVVEQRPVALVGPQGSRLPVAGDGSVLRGLREERRLPVITTRGALPGDKLSNPSTLGLVSVAGAAPAALLARVETVHPRGGKGLVVQLRNGPELYFGSPERLRAKWAAAAVVLADRGSRGAEYVDLRVPDRAVAGGLPSRTEMPREVTAPTGPAGPPPAESIANGCAAGQAGCLPDGPQP